VRPTLLSLLLLLLLPALLGFLPACDNTNCWQQLVAVRVDKRPLWEKVTLLSLLLILLLLLPAMLPMLGFLPARDNANCWHQLLDGRHDHGLSGEW